MQVSEYNGRMPHIDKGEVLHFSGERRTKHNENDDQTLEMYLRKTDDGYDVATLTKAGEYDIGSVTDSYAPNSTFYQEVRFVNPNDFPY